MYAIDPSTGELTPLSTPAVFTGVTPFRVTVDPTGKFVYVANESGTVSIYTIRGDGTLTAAGQAESPTGGPRDRSSSCQTIAQFDQEAKSKEDTEQNCAKERNERVPLGGSPAVPIAAPSASRAFARFQQQQKDSQGRIGAAGMRIS